MQKLVNEKKIEGLEDGLDDMKCGKFIIFTQDELDKVVTAR